MRWLSLCVVLLGMVGCVRGPVLPPLVVSPNIHGYAQGPSNPQEAGDHRLVYTYQAPDGRALKLSFLLRLPRGYDPNQPGRPMVVFLNGVGERGDNLEGIFIHGPAGEMQRNPYLGDWAPCVVLSPQCPSDRRWEDDLLLQATTALIRDVLRQWRVDDRRVSLTGLSMGGTGCWYLAQGAPELFAAVAPISAGNPPQSPHVFAQHMSVSKPAFLIICGRDDSGPRDSGRAMCRALQAQGLDCQLIEVPKEGHGVWEKFYPRRAFYVWLLAHQRGQPADPQRFNAEQLMQAVLHEPASEAELFRQRIEQEFAMFLPYWQILNCGPRGEPGLKTQWQGRANVFVTTPLNPQTPCQLMTTLRVPSGSARRLHLTVGRHPQGQWDLVVRLAGKEILRKKIDAQSAPTGWLDVEVDMAAFAGKEVLVELRNAHAGRERNQAAWARVELSR